MIFIWLILGTALLMEVIGSYLSLFGLSRIFNHDVAVLVYAASLDLAKVVTVSFLYQQWLTIGKAMRAYLTAAVLVLMVVTSVGAYGYLSGAVQTATQPGQELGVNLTALQSEQQALQAEKADLSGQKLAINQQIAKAPSADIDAQRRLINTLRPELNQLNHRLDEINKRLSVLTKDVPKAQSATIKQDAEAGPITYIARSFGVSVETASRYVISVLVAIFEPLSILLIIAANFLIKRRRTEPEGLHEPPPPAPEILAAFRAAAPKPVDQHEPLTEAEIQERILTGRVDEVTTDELVGEAAPAPEPAVLSADQIASIQAMEPQDITPTRSFTEQLSQPEPKPKRSMLEKLTVAIPSALLRLGVRTPSKQRDSYK